jgi:excisionase family DNA binding protein
MWLFSLVRHEQLAVERFLSGSSPRHFCFLVFSNLQEKGIPMTSQPAPKRKAYVTVEEASVLLNMTERTVRRKIHDGTFQVIRDASGFVRIDLEDIEAWNAQKPHQPHPILARLEQQKAQIATLTSQVEGLQHAIQVLAGASNGEALPIWEKPPTELHMLRAPMQFSAAEKRGLPSGTLRMVDFAKEHGITMGMLKSYYQVQAIALTIYQRPGHAERNKQEWWVTPEQHMHIAAYLHEREIAFTPCSGCTELIQQAGA